MLVVDDRTGVRRVAGNHLTAFGDQVIEAASGREALNQLAADDSIALLFTDVIMPGGLSGPALAQRARELRPDLKVLFTSGYAEPAIDGGLSADLLSKPYRQEELARKLRAVLERRDGEPCRPSNCLCPLKSLLSMSEAHTSELHALMRISHAVFGF